MTRISRQGKIRGMSPRKPRAPQPKTGALKDNLSKGYKEHANSLEGDVAMKLFIPKIK